MMRDVFRWFATKGDNRQTYLLVDQYVFTVVTGGTMSDDVIAWNFASPAVARREALRFTTSDEENGWVVGATVWFNHLDVDAQRLVDLCAVDEDAGIRSLMELEDVVVLSGKELA